ncbi:hypothetical protein [Serratia fonticola]|uniref:hypothetical protein n=1 Tax=Serratia fonticola TaxID=47917 RepID=UPI00217B60A5|nr:hypothetical protein [Serratia fonticola]CAI1227311.1 Uncharacterised protein [Serratia fonticola]
MPLIFLSIITVLVVFFWDWISSNMAVLGTAATSLAFFATAWTAYEARSSAKAAFRAVEITRNSLFETKKSSFKQWFSLLLEQHNILLREAEKTIEKESDYFSKIESERNIKNVFISITKNLALTNYVRSVSQILNYIDTEFYKDNADIEEKEQYIEQFSNIIPQKLKLVVAIFGLNVCELETIDNKKLRRLLDKYSFFKNELFFDKVVSQIHFLDRFALKLFNDEFNYLIENTINDRIIKYNFTITYNHERIHQDIKLNILFAYNPIIRKHLITNFEKCIERAKNLMDAEFSKVEQEKKDIDDNLLQLVGCRIVGGKLKNRSGRYTVDSLDILIRIFEHHYYYKDKKGKHLSLDDISFEYNSYGHIVSRNSLLSTARKYMLTKGWIKLKSDIEQDKIISNILKSINIMMMYYRGEIEKI